MAPTAIDIEGVRDIEGIALPDPLTVNAVTARRTKDGRLIAGVAAYTTSDYFKSLVRSILLFFGSRADCIVVILQKPQSEEMGS